MIGLTQLPGVGPILENSQKRTPRIVLIWVGAATCTNETVKLTNKIRYSIEYCFIGKTLYVLSDKNPAKVQTVDEGRPPMDPSFCGASAFLIFHGLSFSSLRT
jgi:hypothetical protein